jgi:hypothetical protein
MDYGKAFNTTKSPEEIEIRKLKMMIKNLEQTINQRNLEIQRLNEQIDEMYNFMNVIYDYK